MVIKIPLEQTDSSKSEDSKISAANAPLHPQTLYASKDHQD